MREMSTKVMGLTKLTGQNIIYSVAHLIYPSLSSFIKHILGAYHIKIYTNGCSYKTKGT